MLSEKLFFLCEEIYIKEKNPQDVLFKVDPFLI